MTNASENALSSDTDPAPDIWKPALKEAAWAFLAATVLLVIVYALAFKYIHPEFARFMGQDAKPLRGTGKDFIPVSVGKGRKAGSQYIIEDFNDDEAILAFPRAFRAEDYPFIKVNLSGFTRYSKAKILWQQAGDPTTHALEFNRSGDEVTQIAMVYGGEAYEGAIDSIALLFYDGPALGFENNNDEDIVIKSIEFRPFSVGRVAEQILEDWANPPLWSFHSNNFVRATHSRGLLPPNGAIILLRYMALAVIWLRSRIIGASLRESHYINVCIAGFAIVLCLRLPWLLEQYWDSRQRFTCLNWQCRVQNHEVRCARFESDCSSVPGANF